VHIIQQPIKFITILNTKAYHKNSQTKLGTDIPCSK